MIIILSSQLKLRKICLTHTDTWSRASALKSSGHGSLSVHIQRHMETLSTCLWYSKLLPSDVTQDYRIFNIGFNVESAIMDVHLHVNVNTYAWILKHMALKTQHWENRTPLKTERSARSDGGSVWTGYAIFVRYNQSICWANSKRMRKSTVDAWCKNVQIGVYTLYLK